MQKCGSNFLDLQKIAFSRETIPEDLLYTPQSSFFLFKGQGSLLLNTKCGIVDKKYK
jgi:hypothetical protein